MDMARSHYHLQLNMLGLLSSHELKEHPKKPGTLLQPRWLFNTTEHVCTPVHLSSGRRTFVYFRTGRVRTTDRS
jgi:hypothetical protein